MKLQGMHEPYISKRSEATIGDLQVRPCLDPLASRYQKTDNGTRNCFKATFRPLGSERLIVVILPFVIPDNVCQYAA